jgi:crotonobetainyl-CoA:carnitine CoA-transferase CaiB-like acyl-CoA transferase
MVFQSFREFAAIEISAGVSARMCGRWLASLGVQVVRMPAVAETAGGWADHFLDAGKVVLSEGALRSQMDASGIVITDCSDTELAALGVDPRACQEEALLGRVTLFPDDRRVGTSFTVMAATGHLTLNGELGREPVGVWGPQAEHLAGIALATAVVARLHQVGDSQPKGLVEVAASEVLAGVDFSIVPRYAYFGERPPRSPRNSGISPNFPIAFYESKDGYVWLNVSPQHQWEMLATAIERVDLVEDARFLTVVDRKKHYDALNEELAPWFRGRTRRQAVEHLQTFRVPVAPLNTVAEAAQSPQLAHRDFWAGDSAWPNQWFRPLAEAGKVDGEC